MTRFCCIAPIAEGGDLTQIEAIMANNNQQFKKRVDQLDRQHKALANGYYTTIRNDGLIIAHPRRRDTGLPIKYLLVLAVMFFLFKALALSAAGAGTYQSRVNSLSDGNLVERAGAWLLQVDPVTQAVSNTIGLALHHGTARL
jgi:hypothetical protein